jgi:hypothetical protein
MSRKTKMKRQQNVTSSRNTEMSETGTDTSEMMGTAREKLRSAAGTVNNHKLLIAGIAGACGAAIFLMGTATGKRIRDEIQERTLDLYDLVSEQASAGFSRVRDVVQDMLSKAESATESAEESASDVSRRVA